MTIKGVLFAVLFAFSSVLYAADIDGKFAVKGAGRKACADFMHD